MNGGASRWMDVGEQQRSEGTQEVREELCTWIRGKVGRRKERKWYREQKKAKYTDLRENKFQ
jgi:hypothetical protein